MTGSCRTCKVPIVTLDDWDAHQLVCSPTPIHEWSPPAEEYIARQRARNRKNYWAGRSRADTSQDGG